MAKQSNNVPVETEDEKISLKKGIKFGFKVAEQWVMDNGQTIVTLLKTDKFFQFLVAGFIAFGAGSAYYVNTHKSEDVEATEYEFEGGAAEE